MFLTTESGLPGGFYKRLRIISGAIVVTAGFPGGKEQWEAAMEAAIENALGKLYLKALELGADAVLGIHIAPHANMVAVMGTAIKFLDEDAPKAVHDQSDQFML